MYFFRREGIGKHHRFCKKKIKNLELGVWEKTKGVAPTAAERPKILSLSPG